MVLLAALLGGLPSARAQLTLGLLEGSAQSAQGVAEGLRIEV
jgi:hypothetical protein